MDQYTSNNIKEGAQALALVDWELFKVENNNAMDENVDSEQDDNLDGEQGGLLRERQPSRMNFRKNFMWRKIEPQSTFVEKKWQISGLAGIWLIHSCLQLTITATMQWMRMCDSEQDDNLDSEQGDKLDIEQGAC